MDLFIIESLFEKSMNEGIVLKFSDNTITFHPDDNFCVAKLVYLPKFGTKLIIFKRFQIKKYFCNRTILSKFARNKITD